ncbi:DUF547 domain-containing protein [Methylobacter sp. YRD-M1]|uniref:DUF547 domain-containing protein n=1 Tax=Methylobacter sp. YRD-M1 TaxID=2911520 RepID=UPI00227A970C|nr:DUF547 domain-containing protein [Methylobacter sp. YRD-M1]WAK03319.1 DUF547 domain-containing protein [Methylobacter sp. YRD-M1]
MRHKTIIWLIAGLLFSAWSAYAQEPDWTSYQTVLKHVKPGSKNNVSLMLVDYSAIKNNDSLDKAYRDLAAFKLERLTSREEKLAFYINAYNILAMKIVADHWPTESIKDIGSLFSPVWDKPAGELGGKTVTLGEVEHSILRPMGEPRIHLAIVCASVSCPDLRNEPYLAARLDEQLAEQTRRFLNNTGKGLRVEENTMHVSKIFDWFEDDFKSQGGISAFIKRYKAGLPELILKTNLPYDWAVNGTQ